MADSKKSSISKRSSCYLLNLRAPDKTARRLKLSFQRTSATVIVLKSERTVEASVGFLDVSETGAGIFTPELLNKGSWVELCITEPAILKVRGIVAWSMPVTSGVHNGKFRCRSGIQFVLESEEQKEAVREFMKRATSDPVENMKTAALAVPPPQMQPGNNTDSTLVTPAPAGTPPLSEVPVAEAAIAQPTETPSIAGETVAPTTDQAAPAPGPGAPEAPVPVAAAAADPVADSPPAPVTETSAPAAAPASSVVEGSGTPDSGQQAA